MKLKKVENNILHISNIDIMDGTPLLDIKPYVLIVESDEEIKIGWLKKNEKIPNKRFGWGFIN